MIEQKIGLVLRSLKKYHTKLAVKNSNPTSEIFWLNWAAVKERPEWYNLAHWDTWGVWKMHKCRHAIVGNWLHRGAYKLPLKRLIMVFGDIIKSPFEMRGNVRENAYCQLRNLRTNVLLLYIFSFSTFNLLYKVWVTKKNTELFWKSFKEKMSQFFFW